MLLPLLLLSCKCHKLVCVNRHRKAELKIAFYLLFYFYFYFNASRFFSRLCDGHCDASFLPGSIGFIMLAWSLPTGLD